MSERSKELQENIKGIQINPKESTEIQRNQKESKGIQENPN